MLRLRIYRSSQLSDFGVYLKTVISRTSASSERYAFSHTDDYYFFGFIEDGQCRLNIDFDEYSFGKGSLVIIRPGQVHRIIDASNLSAKFLVIDSVLVDKEEKTNIRAIRSSPNTTIRHIGTETIIIASRPQNGLHGKSICQSSRSATDHRHCRVGRGERCKCNDSSIQIAGDSDQTQGNSMGISGFAGK